MIERSPSFLHSHSYSGRYEQYRSKHDHLLPQTQGEARYLFEQRLDLDAKRYARKKVALDIIGAAIVATGAVGLGIELKRGTLKQDSRALYDLLRTAPDRLKAAWHGLLKQTGDEIGQHAVNGIREALPSQMTIVKADIDAMIKESFAEGMRTVFSSIGLARPRQ